MLRPIEATCASVLISLAVIATPVLGQETAQSEPEAMYYRYLDFASYVKGGSIEPHWMADGSSFWYAEGAPANTVIYKVDPKANTKAPLFDTARLQKALEPLLEDAPPHEGLPFVEFTFADEGERAVEFSVGDERFVLELDTYTITRAPPLAEEETDRPTPQVVRTWRWGWPDWIEVRSPDDRWFLGLEDRNLRLRSAIDGTRTLLTSDGAESYEWQLGNIWGTGGALWSPDGKKLVIARADLGKVHRTLLTYWLGPSEEVAWHYWPRAGEPVPQIELYILDISSKQRLRIDTGKEPDQRLRIIGWLFDSSELLLTREDRTRRKSDLLAADPSTGSTRLILSEDGRGRFVTFVENGEQFIWTSERDGWNHLYLYGLDGALIRRLTEGAFPVVAGAHMWIPQTGVVGVDEEAGWVYFRAQGDADRPYDVHLYRVRLDGTGFSRLTEKRGRHSIQFAPSKDFFLDTHSSPDRPPAVDLRRADGTLVQTLSKAELDALQPLKWKPPEQFVVDAADGTTDLYGVLYTPFDFDPNDKYPVIEYIYGGAWSTVVPRTFTDFSGVMAQALAQLGTIVFIVDGRGTPGRGREFQDVVLGSLGRHEIPDHVATLRQLAEERPYMDMERVGVFGGSEGGYFALRAMLLASDMYHVGVAYAPNLEIGDRLAEYIEPYMALPENDPEGYEYGSNTRLAANLQGRLLLIHGTADSEAPFSGTMKMVDALLRAGKEFDLVVLPDENHFVFWGRYSRYLLKAVRRYFQEHLKL